ncbi:MAG: winged helix-turn-helix transcriptional regulator [Chloroflexi bacterium]|nr:winged helix-turn-helix transcriptional regulator [Chloroflexota bacterium]MBI5956000.1 winged helix-turn-helix transcriptional regulator [Chloroflexota bacterium]
MPVDCVAFCRALSDETRQKILQMLREREMCVSEIVDAFAMSQPTISHHLAVLKNTGLVSDRKEGKQVYYSLDRCCLSDCCNDLMDKFRASPRECH